MNRKNTPRAGLPLALMLLTLLLGIRQAQAEGPLVDVEALDALLKKDSAGFRVVDVRRQSAYQQGHIANAVWADSVSWKNDSLGEGGLEDVEYWNQQLGQLGLEPGSRVVVVGDSITSSATAWWLLRYAGLPEVQLLDGGMAAWASAGKPVTQVASEITPSKPNLKLRSGVRATLKDLNPGQTQARSLVLDVRSPDEFSGRRVMGPRGGHIPGAVNLEWRQFLDKTGKFLSAEKIQGILDDAAVDLKTPVITHCQVGARSSVAFLALEVAGVQDIKNYYRGWSEYSGLKDQPIEK